MPFQPAGEDKPEQGESHFGRIADAIEQLGGGPEVPRAGSSSSRPGPAELEICTLRMPWSQAAVST
jgi:hypothetical protein